MRLRIKLHQTIASHTDVSLDVCHVISAGNQNLETRTREAE